MAFSLCLLGASISTERPSVADSEPLFGGGSVDTPVGRLVGNELTSWAPGYGPAQLLDAARVASTRLEPFLDELVGALGLSSPEAFLASLGVRVARHCQALSRVSEAPGTPASAGPAVSTQRPAVAPVVAPAGSAQQGGDRDGLRCAA